MAVFFTDVWHVEVHKMYDAIGISQFDKESSLFEVKIFIIAGKMGWKTEKWIAKWTTYF